MRRRFLALVAALAVGLSSFLLVPAAAVAAPAQECPVEGGHLNWGFKESFRSYISGTIANGSWTPVAPATYTTPEFSWPAQGGAVDPATGEGRVSFAGAVQFTGHDGLLNTTIANPTLVVASDGTATLLLDVSGVSMEDALAGNTQNVHTESQVPFVSLDLSGTPIVQGAASAVPTTLTEQGHAVFDSYDAGAAFDPVTFSFTLACATATATPVPEQAETAQPLVENISADAGATLWAWFWPVLAAAVVLAVAVTVVVVVLRRRGGRS